MGICYSAFKPFLRNIDKKTEGKIPLCFFTASARGYRHNRWERRRQGLWPLSHMLRPQRQWKRPLLLFLLPAASDSKSIEILNLYGAKEAEQLLAFYGKLVLTRAKVRTAGCALRKSQSAIRRQNKAARWKKAVMDGLRGARGKRRRKLMYKNGGYTLPCGKVV